MLKRARHEKEEYMENLQAFGNPVGEYHVGSGNGESGSALEEDIAEDMDTEESLHITKPDDTSTSDAHPLLFFFDCETTGFRIYNDHITEIAAKVIDDKLYAERVSELESEVVLVENAFHYITEKRYLAGCTKNDKRSI